MLTAAVNPSLSRQCAWCGRVADAAGQYAGEPCGRLDRATHGICPTCLVRTLAEWDAQRRAERGSAAGWSRSLAPA